MYLSSLQPLNRSQQNLKESKYSTFCTKFVFFGPIRKPRWLPWPLIGWDIFVCFSATNELNSMKFDRKQVFNVLYQFCVFRVDRKTKMAAQAADWMRQFRLLLRNSWTEFNKIERTQDLNVLYQVCVVFEKPRWPPWPLISCDILDFSAMTEQNSTKLDRK